MAVLKYKSADGSYKTLMNYNIKSVPVVQGTGDSEEAVMSQKATTDALADKANSSTVTEIQNSVKAIQDALPQGSSTTNTIVLKDDLERDYMKKTDATINETTKEVTVNGKTLKIEEIVNQTVYGEPNPPTKPDVITSENLESSLENYYTKAEVDEAIEGVDVSEQLEDYVLKETAESTYAKKSEIPSLTEYAKSAEVANTYATKTAIEDMATNTKINEKIIPISDDVINSLYHQNKRYVDLGLPSGLLWAECNLGAKSEEDYGLYFSWGETQGYRDASSKGGFSWGTYKFGGSATANSQSKYNSTDGLTTLENEDDAVKTVMGNIWRMPTSAEFKELYDNTVAGDGTKNSYGWIEDYKGTGINGLLRKSKTNDNTIFFPAAGYASGGSMRDVGSYGYYWSSSLNSSGSNYAYYLTFNSSDVNPQYNGYRYYGFSVRGVLAGK